MHVKYFNNLEIHINLSRILANFCASGSAILLEKLFFYGVLERIHADMNLGNKQMVTEALWAVSNLIADNSMYCKKVVNNGIFDKVLQLGRSKELSQRKEALITLSYIANYMPASELMELCLNYEDYLPIIIDGLQTRDQSR
jgi:hypothetical protein